MRRAVVVGCAFTVLVTGCYRAYDFDNDNKADLVWIDLATGAWNRYDPTTATSSAMWTDPGWPAAGDYDGNGRWEPTAIDGASWVSSTGTTLTLAQPAFGPNGSRSDLYAVPGIYDGGHKTLPAWFRDTDATWFIYGHDPVQFGALPTVLVNGHYLDGDIPVPADFDGDGITDLATFSPRTATWHVRSSKTGAASDTVLGSTGVYPAAADFNGDGKAERSVLTWAGSWVVEGQAPVALPAASDYFPTPADFDGDGKADLAYVTDVTAHGAATHWHVPNFGVINLPNNPTCCASLPVEMNLDLIAQIARLQQLKQCVAGGTC